MNIEKGFNPMAHQGEENKEPNPQKMSRREFLKLGLKATVLTGAAIAGYPEAKKIISETLFEGEIKQEIKNKKDYIFEKYGVEINTSITTEQEKDLGITGKTLPLSEQAVAIEVIMQEITKYPPDFFKKHKVEKLGLLKDLSFIDDNGKTQETVALTTELVSEKSGESSFFIYISPGARLQNLYNYAGWRDESSLAVSFHHEFFHLAELCNDEQDTEKWTELNPRGKKSYKGYSNYKFRWWRPDKELLHKIEAHSKNQGFATREGMINEMEDRATTATMMMLRPDRIAGLAMKDKFVEKKVRLCKELYKKWSDGKIDETFWKDLSQRKVTQNYWNKR